MKQTKTKLKGAVISPKLNKMSKADVDYLTFNIAHYIQKCKVPQEVVQSAGSKYIEYCKNPDINNIGTDDEEEIIAWLSKYEVAPLSVFAILKEAMLKNNEKAE